MSKVNRISVLDLVSNVIIGPSSSHTAGAAKIGFEAFKYLGETPKKVSIKLFNSFSDTGAGHKTDLAILGGCIGIDYSSEDLLKSREIARQKGVTFKIKWGYKSQKLHSNTAIIKMEGEKTKVGVVGYSIGGGRIMIVKKMKNRLGGKIEKEDCNDSVLDKKVKKQTYFTVSEVFSKVKSKEELINFIVEKEEESSKTTRKEQFDKLRIALCVMKESSKKGLENSERSEDNLFGGDSVKVLNSKLGILSNFTKKSVALAIAASENNARMGRIVACPTAGASGVIPGFVGGLIESGKFTEEEILESLLVAGFFGASIASRVDLAGSVAGCQAEIGVAGAMAAAMGGFLFGDDLSTIESSASLVLSNLLGLTCDPVLGRVEVPCILRNGIVCSMAIAATEMAISGIKYPISFDEIVESMKYTGEKMDETLKETSLGGLAITRTAKNLLKTCLHKNSVK